MAVDRQEGEGSGAGTDEGKMCTREIQVSFHLEQWLSACGL